MKQNEIKEYRLLYIAGDEIKDNGTRWGTLEQLKADFPGPGWVIIPADEVPENWQEMTIVDGVLVPASAGVLEARTNARKAAELDAIRSVRESRYRAETDALMFDAMEAFARNHPEHSEFSAWLEAKDRIRRQMPKPEPASGQ